MLSRISDLASWPPSIVHPTASVGAAVQAELQSLETAAGDQTKYLRLVETLADFHARLRARADTLDVPERQKVLRLLVKEVLVSRETITIRHSIRMPNSGPDPNGAPRPPHAPQQPPTAQPGPCLCFAFRPFISPLLANIYLHYAFDQWVQAWRRKPGRGCVIVVRYADDSVMGFEKKAMAQRFLEELRERLAKFGLSLHPGQNAAAGKVTVTVSAVLAGKDVFTSRSTSQVLSVEGTVKFWGVRVIGPEQMWAVVRGATRLLAVRLYSA